MCYCRPAPGNPQPSVLHCCWRAGSPGISGGSTSFLSPPPRPAPLPSLTSCTSTPWLVGCTLATIPAAGFCAHDTQHGTAHSSATVRRQQPRRTNHLAACKSAARLMRKMSAALIAGSRPAGAQTLIKPRRQLTRSKEALYLWQAVLPLRQLQLGLKLKGQGVCALQDTTPQ